MTHASSQYVSRCLTIVAYIVSNPNAVTASTKAAIIAGVLNNHRAYQNLPAFGIEYELDYNCENGKPRFAFDHIDAINIRSTDKYHTRIKIRGYRSQKNAMVERRVTWNGRICMCLLETNTVTITSFADNLLFYYRFYFDYLHFPEGSALTQSSSNRPAAGLNDEWLPATLARLHEQYELAETKEQLNGQSCFVMERKGHDKLWIDADSGYSIVRRDLFWDDKINLRHRTVASNHQCTLGFWYPTHVVREVFGLPGEDASLLNKVCGRFELRVKTVSCVVPPESEFMFPIPEGAMVNDRVRRVTYNNDNRSDTIPKETVTAAKEILKNDAPNSKVLFIVALAGCGIVSSLLVAVYYWRSKQRGK